LAYVKPTGKKKLQADLAQQKVRVTQAQEKLNRRINGVPIIESDPKAYELANTAFEAAVKEQTRLQELVDNFKEPEKKLSKFEADKKRQEELKAGVVPPPGSTVSGDPNTDQTGQVDNFDALVKTAREYVKKTLDNKGRLALAEQLKAAGLDVPITGEYTDVLAEKYKQAIINAKGSYNLTKEYSTVDSYLNEQARQVAVLKAAGGVGGEDERYKPFGQQEIYNRSTAEGVIDSIFTSLNLGREASKTEIDTLYKQLQAEQKKLSSISKGTYKMVNGRRVLVQESGLDARTFLENKVKELPAYKESQVAKSEKTKNTLAATALANGYNLETDFALQLPGWLEAVNNGKSIDEFQNVIRANARRSLPEAVRNQIPPTEDLGTTFSTYLSKWSKSRGLPINYANLSKVIPLAYNDKGFATDKEFTIANRSQPDWEGGPEAIDIYSKLVNDTLKDFGMIGQGVRTV
jgi:hypothetical protein